MLGKVELMAPAGSFDALKAAVNAGANAVYLGGNRFGARHFANNFNNEELEKAISFAHLRDVKIYVTVNTLIADEEFEALSEYIKFLSDIRVDGIIVQDLGVLALSLSVAPDLPVLASTQLTVTNSEGVLLAEKMGFIRTVLARETSLKEMKLLCEKADSEIEAFVHGALCMSYSGQCLMSSLIGGRSGNRGQCAQPCRLPYVLIDDQGNDYAHDFGMGKYLLSPKDLNTLELIPELIDAGVASFKIEGRMKRPEYVAVVTDIYRKAIDSHVNEKFSLSNKMKKNIKQIFNRDFTTAYLKENPGKEILSDKRPNNRGVQIGRINDFDREKGTITIKLEEDIALGDKVEVWVSVGGRVSDSINEIKVNKKNVEKAFKGELATIRFPYNVSKNDRVFRVYDNDLMMFAQGFFQGNDDTISVSAHVLLKEGKPLQIEFTDEKGNKGTGFANFVTEKARKHALTQEKVLDQVSRLGNTDFYIENVDFEWEDGMMVPVSEINEARRQALENLKNARLDAFLSPRKKNNTRFLLPSEKQKEYEKTLLSVHVDSLDKIDVSLKNGADIIIFGGDSYNHHLFTKRDYIEAINLVHSKNKKIYIASPRIISESNLPFFLSSMETLRGNSPDGLLVSSFGAFLGMQKLGLPLWIDYTLNTFNAVATDLWGNLGVEGLTLSQELTLRQVNELNKRSLLPLECVVHARVEMMITEYCAVGSVIGKKDTSSACNKTCEKRKYYLKDRKDELFPIVTDGFCRMHVLNAKELSLLDNMDDINKLKLDRIRVDARYIEKNDIGKIVSAYKKALHGEKNELQRENFTKGHFYRGVTNDIK